MIKVTANALRQQVVNREARRVDKEIKEVLGEKHVNFMSERLSRLVQNPDIQHNYRRCELTLSMNFNFSICRRIQR